MGGLEDLLVTNAHAAERVAPSDKAADPASPITQSAKGIGGVRGHLNRDNAVMWADIAGFMVERFTEHLRRLPHEDDTGLYFAG